MIIFVQNYIDIYRSYRVSYDFDQKLQYLQNYFDKELDLQYMQSEILDQMMELYIARVMMNSNIISELFKETIDATLQQLLISNAKMLNVLHEDLEKLKPK